MPAPLIGKNNVLVKVHYSFISTGTEGATVKESKKNIFLKSLSNTTDKINKVMSAVKENGIPGTIALVRGSLQKSMAIGYSCSGKVVQIGENITDLKVGDYVACAGANMATHSEYVSIPKNLVVKLGKKSSLKESSLIAMGAIALQGIRRAKLSIGENVCIIGLGLIGQITAQLAKKAGCNVFGVDIDNQKLFLAEKLGCDHVYNSYQTNIKQDIQFHTQHHGIDATIITAGAKSGKIIDDAMKITRRKGKVVLVGDVKIDFCRSPFYEKEIDFLISCSYGPGRYDRAYEHGGIDYPYSYVRWTENRNMKLFANMIEKKEINILPLISHEFDFIQAPHAYKTLLAQGKNTLGILLKYETEQKLQKILPSKTEKNKALPSTFEHHTEPSPSKTDLSSLSELFAKEINIAFVGAGGFAKTKLLPILSKIKKAKSKTKIHFSSIIDTDTTNAKNVAILYDSPQFDNDYKKILFDKNIDTVFIATPHVLHAEQAISALAHNKNVFIEKPAAVNFDQYVALKRALNKNKNTLYCVDFNRSFAPFNIKIKKVIENRTTPVIIHYRMNAGFIDKKHWIQSAQNGGRIIGEACHIFELFSFLTGSKPQKISTSAIDTNRNDILQNDNFSAQISFEDGSICTLLYTSIGNNLLPKERMEVFFDGKSIVMDDYKTLTGYGLPKSFNEKKKYSDKGHQNLITQFFDAIKNGLPSPISRERILLATELSLEINNQANNH